MVNTNKLVGTFSIGRNLALNLQQDVVEAALAMGISGFVVIYSSGGMQLCSMAVGPEEARWAKPLNAQVALAKIETVLIRRQSISVWRAMIEKLNLRPEYYAGAVKTLFRGGLAIFADKECKEFIGAIAFSGGEEWQDHNICRDAILFRRLFTDAEQLKKEG